MSINEFDIELLKAAINELKTNPNACMKPPAICSETEFSPLVANFFNYVAWGLGEAPIDFNELDGNLDTLREKFGNIIKKEDVKHYTLGEAFAILCQLHYQERVWSGCIYNEFQSGYLLELLEHILRLILDLKAQEKIKNKSL